MAPLISDAVVVDVFRRVDRLLTPLVTRLGRPPSLPQHDSPHAQAGHVQYVDPPGRE